MKLRVSTFGKEIGTMVLAKGATLDDVHEAIRRHQLWIVDEDEKPADEAPTSAYHLPPEPGAAPTPKKAGKELSTTP